VLAEEGNVNGQGEEILVVCKLSEERPRLAVRLVRGDAANACVQARTREHVIEKGARDEHWHVPVPGS
jgi:hypothetical protein